MTATGAFLLAFPALFSIVNPPGSALLFREVTAGFAAGERAWLAGKVAVYSALVILGALWGGAYVLNFFGITLDALRLAGGAVVTANAWRMLNAPDQPRESEAGAKAERGRARAIAFFPLTLPLTAGPGTISVAVTLGAERPPPGPELIGFFLGATLAAVAVAASVWASYRSAERLDSLLGEAGRRAVTRLTAFLLLCIGVQIMLNGAVHTLEALHLGG